MIFIQLTGGLGNQLFQYAFGRSLSYDLDQDLYIDISHFNWQRHSQITHILYGLHAYNIKGIVGNYPYSKEMKNNGINMYYEGTFSETTNFPNINYIRNLNKIELPAYFQGFWNAKQCNTQKHFITEKYFVHNQDIIREDLQLTAPLSKRTKELLDDMNNYDAIAIHIRRGDYMNFSEYGTGSVKYYLDSINTITKNLKNPKFYIFTEDYDWVRENLKFNYPSVYVPYINDKNQVGNGYYDLLYSMQSCDHFIMANSTFSWWGAWLSDNKNKIIVYPKPWFQSHRIEAIDSINNKTKNIIATKNNYSEFFDNSNKTIYSLNSGNYVKNIKEVQNVDLYEKNKDLIIKTQDKTSKVILRNIKKKNPENAVIIHMNIISNNSNIFSLVFRDKDNQKDSLKYYYYKNEILDQYIILPNDIKFNDLTIIPSNKRDTTLCLKSFDIKEITDSFKTYMP